MRKFIYFLGLFCSAFSVFSQSLPSSEMLQQPTTFITNLSPIQDDLIYYPEENIDSLIQDLNNQQGEEEISSVVSVFGVSIETNIDPLLIGQWTTIKTTSENDSIEEEYRVWRIKLTSPSAYSLSVFFDNLNLPANSSLFVYNDDLTQIAGPFTETYNQQIELSSGLIQGESVTIEFVYKVTSDFTLVSPFQITGVVHDFNNEFENMIGKLKPNVIGSCHNNVNCPIGDDWQIVKQSVVLIHHYNHKGISYTSTGTLLNNTKRDNTPYILYAEHALNYLKKPKPNTWVFYFNHEAGCEDNGSYGNTNHAVFGGANVSQNQYSDFALLRLNAQVPSSYQSYFAGWDRTVSNPNDGTGIHHPGGHPKKISVAHSGLIIPNPIAFTSSGKTYQANTMWEVKWQSGTTQGGSSGSALFNENKRVVGNLLGGHGICSSNPDYEKNLSRYGRFSLSWDYGSSSSSRLKDWLDPINSNPTEINGYIPAGWRNDWLTGWDQPSAHKTHPQVKSIAVGEGGQVFYRGTDNKMQVYYHDGTNWVHDWVRGWSIPSHELIAGDVVVGEGNQLFYRGTDGKIHTYYWTTSGWQHDWLTGWNSPSHENVSAVPGSIAVGNGNQVFYRGTDNKMHTYYWTTSGWQHAWIVNAAPSWQNVAGDIVVGKSGGQNQVYYRGTDGKMQVYWFNFSTSQWNHGWITSGSSPSYENVSSVAGSIAVGSDNKIYYRGTDNLVHLHYWEAGSWHHGWMINGAGSDQKISGNITVNNGDQVFYRGFDGKMHVYWYNNTANEWVHDWIENSWQAPTLNNIAGSIDAGNGGSIFYRANNDGLVRVYFWGNSAMLRPSKNEYYGMEDVTTKPKIPMYNSTLEMTAYPNPVETILNVNISTNQDDKYLFTLTDVSGRVVLSEVKQLSKGFNKIDIQLSNTVNSGLYIFSAQNQRTLESVQTKISKL